MAFDGIGGRRRGKTEGEEEPASKHRIPPIDINTGFSVENEGNDAGRDE